MELIRLHYWIHAIFAADGSELVYGPFDTEDDAIEHASPCEVFAHSYVVGEEP